MVKHLEKEEDFNKLIEGKILVDFYADWCGPCQRLAPLLEEINSIEVLKVNVDEFPNLASKYGVMSIPMLVLFKDGKAVKKEVGFHSLEQIRAIIA